MRKTKIICTIGPASEDRETLTKLCLAGMNVARLNFSHGTHEEHRKKIGLIKSLRAELGLPVAILLDTKGPEYRIGTFQNGSVTVRDGERFTFTTDDVPGDESRVSVSYKGLVADLALGDRILVNDGLVIFEVEELSGSEARCRVITGGVLSDRKSMCFPNKVMTGPFLSEQDKRDLLFGIENGVDFVAASFVSSRQDMQDIRDFLAENGGGDIRLIAKIENRSGVDAAEEICDVADGLMVARGDLGVEIPYVEVPSVQKKLIRICRRRGKQVITATEMLESMIENPRPTRAEISDVANAVYDGSTAVMLSGESAAGRYPVEALKAMDDICEFTEKSIDYEWQFRSEVPVIRDRLDAVSHAVCAMAVDVKAKGIAVCSLSGKTAAAISSFRCGTDIVGITAEEKVFRRLALDWGVTPVMAEADALPEELIARAVSSAAEALGLQPGDTVAVTGGSINGRSGSTDTIRIKTVE